MADNHPVLENAVNATIQYREQVADAKQRVAAVAARKLDRLRDSEKKKDDKERANLTVLPPIQEQQAPTADTAEDGRYCVGPYQRIIKAHFNMGVSHQTAEHKAGAAHEACVAAAEESADPLSNMIAKFSLVVAPKTAWDVYTAMNLYFTPSEMVRLNASFPSWMSKLRAVKTHNDIVNLIRDLQNGVTNTILHQNLIMNNAPMSEVRRDLRDVAIGDDGPPEFELISDEGDDGDYGSSIFDSVHTPESSQSDASRVDLPFGSESSEAESSHDDPFSPDDAENEEEDEEDKNSQPSDEDIPLSAEDLASLRSELRSSASSDANDSEDLFHDVHDEAPPDDSIPEAPPLPPPSSSIPQAPPLPPPVSAEDHQKNVAAALAALRSTDGAASSPAKSTPSKSRADITADELAAARSALRKGDSGSKQPPLRSDDLVGNLAEELRRRRQALAEDDDDDDEEKKFVDSDGFEDPDAKPLPSSKPGEKPKLVGKAKTLGSDDKDFAIPYGFVASSDSLHSDGPYKAVGDGDEMRHVLYFDTSLAAIRSLFHNKIHGPDASRYYRVAREFIARVLDENLNRIPQIRSAKDAENLQRRFDGIEASLSNSNSGLPHVVMFNTAGKGVDFPINVSKKNRVTLSKAIRAVGNDSSIVARQAQGRGTVKVSILPVGKKTNMGSGSVKVTILPIGKKTNM